MLVTARVSDNARSAIKIDNADSGYGVGSSYCNRSTRGLTVEEFHSMPRVAKIIWINNSVRPAYLGGMDICPTPSGSICRKDVMQEAVRWYREQGGDLPKTKPLKVDRRPAKVDKPKLLKAIRSTIKQSTPGHAASAMGCQKKQVYRWANGEWDDVPVLTLHRLCRWMGRDMTDFLTDESPV